MSKIKFLTKKEKETKYKAELALGVKITNDFKLKLDKEGKEIPLKWTDKSYRTGYINALKK